MTAAANRPGSTAEFRPGLPPSPFAAFDDGDDPQESAIPSQLFRDFALHDNTQEPIAGGDEQAELGNRGSLEHELLGGRWLASEEVVEGMGRARTLPRSGEVVMGFRLIRELGRGAFARVFLAEQIALAGRHVAVKISYTDRDESQTLAQLQHTHIVPVYSAHFDEDSGLRVLVMPYHGGATLDRLLAKAGLNAQRHLTGMALVTALDNLATPVQICDASSPVAPSQPHSAADPTFPGMHASEFANPWRASRLLGRAYLGTWRGHRASKPTGTQARDILAHSTYIHAITWIACRLAEGLAHAHHRGILHRDIKLSNVLIASDGQPMLLDFNLASDLKCSKAGAVAYVGGTLPYMAPEHLDAFNVANPTNASAVTQRSDVYSLGVVLYEMLTNRNPFPIEAPGESLAVTLDRMAAQRREQAPSARGVNPAVPQSLDAIVRRCLDPVPDRRYTAEQLAEDLQRELDNLPLKHTPEPSWNERLRKWARRHPRLSSGGTIAAVAATVVATLTYLVLVIGGRLAGYDAERRWINFQEGVLKAQLLVFTGSEPGQNLEEGRRICEQTLDLFDILDNEHWQSGSTFIRLHDKARARLPEDATELMILLARVHAEQARLPQAAREQNDLARRAVQLLDQAERLLRGQAPRALYEDRGNYRALLGDQLDAQADWHRAAQTPVRTARDHYLLATSLAVDKRYADAVRELKAATAIDPKHFWAHFELGICYYQLGEFAKAAGAYNVCEAIWVECAWTNLNRGLTYSRMNQWKEAIADYSSAIRKDPNFADAYVNRGLAQLHRGNYREAVVDLDRAIDLGRASGPIWAARGTAHAGLKQWTQARSDFERALQAQPDDAAIRQSRGFAMARHDPELALKDFEWLLARNQSTERAWYGKAYVLSEMPERRNEAVAAARQAAELAPNRLDYRAALAVLLARGDDFDEAIAIANATIERARSAELFHAAASVYALASRRQPDLADKAVALVSEAIALGYPTQRIAVDADLSAIRAHPAIRELLQRNQGPSPVPFHPAGSP